MSSYSDMGPSAQLERFDGPDDLVRYVCSTSTRTSYDPVCPFPYINGNWGAIVSQSGTDFSKAGEVDFPSCNITFASALHEVGYDLERWLQICASFMCFAGSLWLSVKLRGLRLKVRKAAGRHQTGAAAPSPSEIIAWLNILSSLCQLVCWVDYWGFEHIWSYVGA